MSDDDKFPSQLAERFQIRMPDGLRDELRAAAEASNRSMNSEIVWRLMQSLGNAPDGPSMTLQVPEDLQKRIAIAATRHEVSPEDEILNVLQELYPAPRTAAVAAQEIERIAEIISPASSMPEIERLLGKLQELAVAIYRGRVSDIAPETRNEILERYEAAVIDDTKDRSRPPIGSDDV